ncbi:hypothetical protein QE152_g15675 [Popillia japonica]|uniref:Peptidase A2 domain-containing protein n=1 Tax=Popillia japonica TaxID=7064 RepID=A0AAW1L4Y0_POPJA
MRTQPDIKNHIRKQNLLLYVAGSQVQDIFFTLPASEDTTSEDLYKVTMDALDAYFSPKINTAYERYIFRTLKQEPNKTVEQFITRLKEQSKLCNYQDVDDQIRDQVIEKCRSSQLRRKLLEKGDIKLKEVSETARAYEAAEVQWSQMEGVSKSVTSTVNAVTHKDKKKIQTQHKETSEKKINNQRKCFRWGSDNHLANKCKYVKTKCHLCAKSGHLMNMCLSKKANVKNQISTVSDVGGASVNAGEEVVHLYQLNASVGEPELRKKFWCTAVVEGIRIKFELDTGAAVTLMRMKDFKNYFPNVKVISQVIQLTTYCGTKLDVFGYATVNVTYKFKLHPLCLYVVNSDNHPLLGREWIRKLNLDLTLPVEINKLSMCNEKSNNIDVVLSEYKPLFEKNIGKIEGIQAQLRLKPKAKPVFVKSRPVPFALQERVKEELKSLQKQGILEPVNASTWATAIVPVVKATAQFEFAATISLH